MPKYSHGTVIPVAASTCFRHDESLYGMLHTFQGESAYARCAGASTHGSSFAVNPLPTSSVAMSAP